MGVGRNTQRLNNPNLNEMGHKVGLHIDYDLKFFIQSTKMKTKIVVNFLIQVLQL